MGIALSRKLELVQRAKHGDQIAISELWELYKNLVWKQILKLSLDPDLQDELQQAGFLYLMEAVRLFDLSTRGSFTTHLYGHLRALASHAKNPIHRGRQVRETETLGGRDQVDAGPLREPSQIASERDLFEEVEDILQDSELAQIVRLKCEGHSARSASEELGLSHSTVQKKWTLAIRKLQEELGPELADPDWD